MIKIMFVIENVFFGGGERAFAQLINGLDKDKFEIYVACQSGGIFEEKIKNSAKIFPFDFRGRFSLLNICRLAKLMQEKNIQLAHSQGGRADFFSRIAARMAKVPAVVSTVAMPVEGYDVCLLKKLAYIALDRFSEHFVDKFIVVSEALERRLLQEHKIPPGKISKIYNGIEAEAYSSAILESGRKIKNEFNIGPDVRLAGVIGRLVWQKGLVYFIQAIKQMKESESAISDRTRYLVVGEGKLRKELENFAKKLKLEKNIIFTGFREDIREILAALDILVLPSIQEGQPIILLEAMAMGKPVVATNIEGINETAVNGLTAMLIPPRNPSALANALICLFNDSEKNKQMGQAAVRLVEEKFNLKDKIEQHRRLYEAIVKEKLSAKSILVIQLAGLGDMVLALPSLSALRDLYPQSKIFLLTNSRSVDIIRGSKEIDEIFISDNLGDFLRMLKRLRRYNFDIIINLYRLHSFKGALKMFLLFLSIGGKYWVGRNTDARGFFYHLKVAETSADNKHEVEHKLDIIQALGGKVRDINFKIELDKQDDDFVQTLLEKEGVKKEDILVGINCATFRPERNWTVSGYAQLAEALMEEFKAKVVFCARREDRGLFYAIQNHSSAKFSDFVGKLTVRQLAAFIKACRLFISGDSGPMHLAAALRAPLISLFGQGEYSEFRPFGDERIIRVIRTPIELISAQEVFKAAKELLFP